jgi:signal transduction histidine kinase
MFRPLLIGTFGAVLALTLACAGLAWWTASVAVFQMERTRHVHEVLHGHLHLESEADRLLQAATEAAFGDNVLPFPPGAAREALRAQFARIRRHIAAEVAMAPASAAERDELEQLARLEELSHGFVQRIEDAASLTLAGSVREARAQMRAAVQAGLGTEFRQAVHTAVDRERADAIAAEQEAERITAAPARLARLMAGLAVLVAVIAAAVLMRRLQRPLDQLAGAAEAVAEGDFSRRVVGVPEAGTLGRVVRSFNAMLDEVARSRAALQSSHAALEQAVQARTAELAAANAALQRSDEVRRRFLADASHELRTPLTIIRGEAEVALRGADKPVAEYRHALGRVAEEAAHTARLVDDLLFVARSEAGEARSAKHPVALDEIVQGALVAARTLAAPRGISVGARAVPHRIVVQGDPDRLRQLALILLDNAVRYSDPGGEVFVELQALPGLVRLVIADDGMGIAPEELERVFERFHRGRGASARHVGGSGLGLPLARAIARAHGGEVRLENRQDRGTVALVELPAAHPLQAVA